MTRFEVASSLFDQRKLFKLVCGAGNEDALEVEKLVFIYTLAGAKLFDVSANVDVVRHAMQGIDKAQAYAAKLGRKIMIRPFINVSIGMAGDPHVRKAFITVACVKCGQCRKVCPQMAIEEEIVVIQKKCIGCGICAAVCPVDAIKFQHQDRNLKSLLLECRQAGAEQLELHAAVTDTDVIADEWRMVNEIIPDNYVSMCLDRLNLGNTQFMDRVKKARLVSGERFIVQADGVPMSGGADDFNTTLQAIAVADVVMKSGVKVRVLLSGGTNSRTAELADLCGVRFDGVAIGTFARKIIRKDIEAVDFWEKAVHIENAVRIADQLVHDNIGEPIW